MAKTEPQETKFATVLGAVESELDSFSSYMLPRLITEWETQYPNIRMSDHMDANDHLRVCEILNRRTVLPPYVEEHSGLVGIRQHLDKSRAVESSELSDLVKAAKQKPREVE